MLSSGVCVCSGIVLLVSFGLNLGCDSADYVAHAICASRSDFCLFLLSLYQLICTAEDLAEVSAPSSLLAPTLLTKHLVSVHGPNGPPLGGVLGGLRPSPPVSLSSVFLIAPVL